VKRRDWLVPTASALAAVVGVMVCAAAGDQRPAGRPRDALDKHSELVEPADPAVAAFVFRSAAKGEIVREVIAGRRSLPEAAALFGWLDAISPRTVAIPPHELAARAGLADENYTADELLAVQVVARVAIVAREDSPAQAAELTARVRGEFLAAREAGRFDRLPEIPDADLVQLIERAEAEVERMMTPH
jgi:hypothetical protein